MAQAVDRSMVAEFRQGCIDNSYIQLAPGVGGLVEMTGRVDRAINQMPYQYMNVEVKGLDPFDLARVHRASIPLQPHSRYVPRRDRVGRGY
jgi:hypothetical protein